MYQSEPAANISEPSTPGRRYPKRAPRRAPGIANAAAIAGPGNSISPAVSASSCQTPVRNRTPPSSIAPKPAKNTSEPPTASPKRRTRSIAGSTTGRRLALRAPPQPGQQDRRDQQQPEHASRAPAPFLALNDRHHERPDRHDQRRRAEHVRPAGVLLAVLAQRANAGGQRGQADRHVDEEHEPPVGLHEQPAQRRPGGRGDPAGRRPQPDRDVPLLGLELRQHQAERGRQHQRAAGRLDDPCRDQRADRRRGRAGCAGQHEHAQAQQEGPLATEGICPPAGRHEQRGEHDRVRAQDPRERAERHAAELSCDRGEGDVHDEHVEARHEHARHDDQRDPPLPLHHATDPTTEGLHHATQPR